MKTKYLAVFVVLSLVAFAKCSLLEMSQSLWSQLLAGGISKVGSLDPLRVPVIKVDQSEGNTSYRLILRNVEIAGLNSSTLESIHVARGRLKSNLSELEAGYVSYSDLSGADAIRYRFHTMVKDSNKNQSFERLTAASRDQGKVKTAYASGRYEGGNNGRSNQENSQYQRYQSGRYVDQSTQRYDAQYSRVQDSRVEGNQRGQYTDQASRQYDRQNSGTYEQREFTKGGGGGGVGSGSRQNNQQQYYREQERFNGGDRENYGSQTPRQYDSRQPSRVQSSQPYESAQIYQGRESGETDRIRSYDPGFSRLQEARPDVGRQRQTDPRSREYNVEFARAEGEGRFEYSGQLRQDDQRTRYEDDQGTQYRDFYPRAKTTGSAAPLQYVRGSGSQSEASSSERGQDDSRYFGTSGTRGSYVTDGRSRGEAGNYETFRKGEDAVDCRGACQQGQYRVREEYADQDQRADVRKYNGDRDSTAEGFEVKLSKIEERKDAETLSEDPSVFVGGRPIERGHSANDCRYPRQKSEKEPGYIDIVYADGKENSSVKHFGNLRIDPKEDAKVYGLDEIMRDIRENRRFIVHNFTEGEALSKRNDAILTALEAKRMKDLIRTGTESPRANDGRRTKRADLQDEKEDDVMHVILRVKVPILRVQSQYELTGKVGKEVLRGNGKLVGNFTELIGDFTIELKKAEREQMIVRAARARLVAKDKKVSLQGMDMKGPVESVLNYGLMAAEAVAAMLADDLATKALTEKTADALVYRMYKNLPSN